MLDKDEEKELVTLLRKLEPGYFPLKIFWEFARLNKLTAMEIVPFIKSDYEEEDKVLLIKRGEEDLFWSGQYHTPGCIVRGTDTLDNARDRVYIEELASPMLSIDITFSHVNSYVTPRGRNLGLVHFLELNEKPSVGEVFSLDSLPNNIVGYQVEMIFAAYKNYKRLRKKELVEVGEFCHYKPGQEESQIHPHSI